VDSPEVGARIRTALALVSSVLREMDVRQTVHASKDDLKSFGNEGALVAGRTYDPNAGRTFEHWVRLKIRAAIVDGLRVQGGLPRGLYARLRAIEAANWAHDGMTFRDPASPPPGSAGAAEAPIGDRLAAMATAYAARALLASDDETLNSLRDARGTPEDELAREELKARICAAINSRPNDERALLEGYYYGGTTMSEAAGGLSRPRASRLHAQALRGVARSLIRLKLTRRGRAPRGHMTHNETRFALPHLVRRVAAWEGEGRLLRS
jgi:RNA polymerase sigma factor (sigma-70 family)